MQSSAHYAYVEAYKKIIYMQRNELSIYVTRELECALKAYLNRFHTYFKLYIISKY